MSYNANFQTWNNTHRPCPCGKSSDAYSEGSKGGKCFSCGKWFPLNDSKEEQFTYQYLDQRGIKASTFKKYGSASKINKDGEPIAIAFPYSENAVKIRSLKEKTFYTQGAMKDASLFGMDLFASGSAEGIIITEGEFDAISAHQMSGLPAVSVRSAVTAYTDCSKNLDYLKGFRKVYLCFDNDEHGREATKRVAALIGSSAYHIKLSGSDKDANDFLKRNGVDEFNNILFYSRRFLPEEVVSSYNEVQRILSEEKKRPIMTYPFKRIQEMTYGIRPGVILITAQEGQGKTEIVRAIEAHALKTTDCNIGIIHLEESKQRSIQGLAGYELKAPTHLPDSNVSLEEIFDGFKRITKRDERVYLVNHFDGDDPDAALDLIRFLVVKCECGLVVLDHITQLVSALEGEDERKKLDFFCTKIEQMTVELDFPLIMVSHVNDEGKTRGSRYISKVASVRIDLERDHLNPNEIERNKTYTRISKNRDGAKTGPSSILYFNPETFVITEWDEADDFSEQRLSK